MSDQSLYKKVYEIRLRVAKLLCLVRSVDKDHVYVSGIPERDIAIEALRDAVETLNYTISALLDGYTENLRLELSITMDRITFALDITQSKTSVKVFDEIITCLYGIIKEVGEID